MLSSAFVSVQFAPSRSAPLRRPRCPRVRTITSALPSEADAGAAGTPGAPDGLPARAAIALFRRVLAPHVAWASTRRGYDGLVDECRMLLARNEPRDLHAMIGNVLGTLFVAPYGPAMFRRFFAHKPEVNANITPAFFHWLVGPSEQNDSPEDPTARGTGVLIEKCRFLDVSGCKGLCLNICQQPTQKFFTESLGLPLRMTPDFETKSCQLTFGMNPLAPQDDPAHLGGCLEGCKMSGSFTASRDRLCKDDKVCYAEAPPAGLSTMEVLEPSQHLIQ